MTDDIHNEHKMDIFTDAIMRSIRRTALDQGLCPTCCGVNIAGAIIQEYAGKHRDDLETLENLLGFVLKSLGAEKITEEEFKEQEESINKPFRTLH